MAQDAVIRLLLVEDQLEDAEHLISMLRNGGMAIRPQRPESLEDLDNLLGNAAIDMVLARGDAKYIAFSDVAKRIEATGKDIPVLATADKLDEARSAHRPTARAKPRAQQPEHVS